MTSLFEEIEFGDFEEGHVKSILKSDCSAVQIYWEPLVPLFQSSGEAAADYGTAADHRTGVDRGTAADHGTAAQPAHLDTASDVSHSPEVTSSWGGEWIGSSSYVPPFQAVPPPVSSYAVSHDTAQGPPMKYSTPHNDIHPVTSYNSMTSYQPVTYAASYQPAVTSYSHDVRAATSYADTCHDYSTEGHMMQGQVTRPHDQASYSHRASYDSHPSGASPGEGFVARMAPPYYMSDAIPGNWSDVAPRHVSPYNAPHNMGYNHRQERSAYTQANKYSNYPDNYKQPDGRGYQPEGRSKLYDKTYERRNKKKRPPGYYDKIRPNHNYDHEYLASSMRPSQNHMASGLPENYDKELLQSQMPYSNQPAVVNYSPGMVSLPNNYVVDTSVPPPGMFPVNISQLPYQVIKPVPSPQGYISPVTDPSVSKLYEQTERPELVHSEGNRREGTRFVSLAPCSLAPANDHLNTDSRTSQALPAGTGDSQAKPRSHVDSQREANAPPLNISPVIVHQDQAKLAEAELLSKVPILEQPSYRAPDLHYPAAGDAAAPALDEGKPQQDTEVPAPQVPAPQVPAPQALAPQVPATFHPPNTSPEFLDSHRSDQEHQKAPQMQGDPEASESSFSFLGDALPSVDISQKPETNSHSSAESAMVSDSKRYISGESDTSKDDPSPKEKQSDGQKYETETVSSTATATGTEQTASAGQEPRAMQPSSEDNSVSKDTKEVTTDEKAKPETKQEAVASEEAKPKPSSVPKVQSWASLFKKEPSANTAPVFSYDVPSEAGNKPNGSQEPSKDDLPQTVPTAEDKAARQLGEFLVSYKLNHKFVCLQPRGLVNKANWCYVNATLQALLACPPFYHLMKSLPAVRTNVRAPSSTPVMDSLVQFVSECHTMPPLKGPDRGSGNKGNKMPQDLPLGPAFEPSYVYKMLQVIHYDAAFKHGRQEDAEEFLSCLLNGLHEEMVAATRFANAENGILPDNNSNGSVVESEEEEESETEAGDQWEQVGPRNKSVVTRAADFNRSPTSEIFTGHIRSLLHKQGLKESATLQPFFTLQLDIQSEKIYTLKDALDALVSMESIHGFTCSKTKKEVEASRRILLEELPPILVLHLKWMVYDSKSGGIQKIFKKIEFDVNLDISKDLLSPSARNRYSQNQRNYKLLAVVNHHGSRAVGGHYTTDYFHPGLNGWVQADDSNIKLVSLPSVLKFTHTRVPYLILYRRADLI